MALTLAHTFESGQTSGTTVTTGNSATGGNAFDSVTINATCTCTYDSLAYRGSLGCAVSSGGTSGQGAVNWTSSITSAMAHPFGRILVNASSFSAAHPFLRLRGGAAVQVTRLGFDASGHVQIRNTSNSVVGTSTTVLSTATWYLIRWDITVGASATGVVYIHTDPTSATPAETLTVNSINFGTNNVNEYNAGIGASTLNVPQFNFDDIVLTDVALPGPPIQTITISETVSFAEAVARGFIAPRSVAESFTTADSVGRTAVLGRAVAESLTASDAVARTAKMSRSVAESLTATDSGTGVVPGHLVAATLASSIRVASTAPAVSAPGLASSIIASGGLVSRS